jgi:hypothetical protein
MKTGWLSALTGALVCWSSGVFAQGGGVDASQIQQMISGIQQRIAQADPAQLQDFAARLRPEVAQMDPAQFQDMVNQFQQGLAQGMSQADPAQLQSIIDQFRQGLGNVDPSQFGQQRTASLREQLQITDDAEWSVVNELIQKVRTAQQAIQSDSSRGGRSFSLGTNSLAGLLGRMQQGGGAQAVASALRSGSSSEADALRRAIDARSSEEDTRAALNKLVEVRKAHQAALEKVQQDLRQLLTLRQEAVAIVNGLL